MKTLYFVAAAANLALLQPVSVVASPTRFSAPGVYTGQPELPLTLSMVETGGGPEHFETPFARQGSRRK